jgi:hypothetical protein
MPPLGLWEGRYVSDKEDSDRRIARNPQVFWYPKLVRSSELEGLPEAISRANVAEV